MRKAMRASFFFALESDRRALCGDDGVEEASRAHGPESYGVYVDLVRAFGTVNRGALWEVLREFSMPGHFAGMLVRLNVKIGEEDTAVGSSIGVRRGAC